ncbi:hypothetical protein FOMPIDRAFT_1056533 [Fomitopsis schrenkii]|uniref:Uncharacterized protein n=1 Tax=Fomitopsis schrenkii TaxID=2126942 RepID=S8DJ01_FOMSC|nr:hypothetical protein FOMPIDRAFT_1056533 [Fomitopsis schrenkii]
MNAATRRRPLLWPPILLEMGKVSKGNESSCQRGLPPEEGRSRPFIARCSSQHRICR